MTPHISAKKDQIAKVVLMPGDPLRAKFIAENYLKDYELVNEVRGMLAFTGYYNGTKVTVMGHGMGNPSIGIYSHELFHFYDVDTIIRIGSCGSMVKDIKVGDVMVVNEAFSDSIYAKNIGLDIKKGRISASKTINLIILSQNIAKNGNIRIVDAYSSDAFYRHDSVEDVKNETKTDVVEMEAYALFANATRLNKNAACILTCSDNIITHEELSAIDRQTSFHNMIQLALDAAKEISEGINLNGSKN